MAGWLVTDWKLVVEEAPSLAGRHHIEVEQPFLELASAGVADSLQREHMDFAVEVVVEAHGDLVTEQLEEEHMYWEVEQTRKLCKREPKQWA